MDKKKILIAADTYFPKVDGVLMFMKEFIKRSENDFDIRLLVPKYSEKNVFKSVKTIFLDLSKYSKAFTYEPISLSRDNRRKIKRAVKDADIIFVQELGPVGFLAFRQARKLKKKTIFYFHNTPWDFLTKYYTLNDYLSRIVKRLFVKLYNKADLLLVPYNDFKSELHQMGIKTHMEVARLGVDIERFKPSETKLRTKARLKLNDKTVIGYVGRISNEKNTLILLDAFKKLNDPNLHLLIVGDGQKELVKKFKETKNCTVTGFVKDVEKYLQAMDIFVMPSLTETTSLATLEAMASGVPVVCTKLGFMKHYVVKDYNGLFFPRNSSDMLAVQLKKLLEDQELREKLGRNARKTVAYSFSWERSINKIKRILEK
ncbi:glycosyltransferase [Candidatus Woesearchaeota archaeon]|nr:glycosyltransferase [Candidatus Woesearchaeota archaeon]